MPEENHPDQYLIDGIKHNDSRIIREIYDRFAEKVIQYICKNNGDESQASDIIQEVLITIYKQAINNDLQLTCPFDAYFFLLSKRKWLNELKKNGKEWVTSKSENLSIVDNAYEMAEETALYEEKELLFQEMFQKLSDACKDLLKASFKLKSMEEVAKKLDISYAYARKKKSLCIGKLTELVKSSPKYDSIKRD
ncbi:sigma-70 family RNA polymerase sigma factor [Marivirga harenae]|uniref:RNA polymerase sigma factor n=1 Tax=Marivirga harenae TaxID=2010992 RepID=UPI0026DECA0C|nr:sigma-70 family RNA polymerase sigma factor [Marivirga harenae]WKV10898.1 sigma-70 family RNA polymerase sigma factor [Marivirga harenae]|tara:strand:- start:181495 stop:182076 length:582 start_codon:yes stop_codon:yes gene_type:complete